MKTWCLVMLAVLATLRVLSPPRSAADASLTSLGILPLTDMGATTYKGFVGGLYAGGANQPPPAHQEAGLALAAAVRPLDAAGNPDPTGRVVMVSIGMSNTTQEFQQFKRLADSDPAKNPLLVIVDGAQGGQAVNEWTGLQATAWAVLNNRLLTNGVTTNQVQVAWVKLAAKYPGTIGAFPAHAQYLQRGWEQVLRNLRSVFPNIRIAYLSSRTRAYTTVSNALNPEPFAFESNFAPRWIVEKQIAGDTNLNWNPDRGPVVAPYVAWGPYLWIDGTNSRSDGLTWPPECVQADFIHPSTTGQLVVASQLWWFVKTDPTATPWYLRQSVVGMRPTCTVTADVLTGHVPLTVHFGASATDPDGTVVQYAWNFDDGTGAGVSNPVKRFMTPGVHVTRLTVTDNSGNTTSLSVTVTALDNDTDGDGMADMAEALAGTDPTNAASVLRLAVPTLRATGGGVEADVSWASASNRSYELQRAADLLVGFDHIVRSNIPATPPQNTETDTVAGAGAGFYRVRLLTPPPP